MRTFKKLFLLPISIAIFFLARMLGIALKIKKIIDWGIPPAPHYFDHRIDLYSQWPTTANPMWLERGVHSLFYLRKKRVLELCCGDGFNTKHFYSYCSQSVKAVDLSEDAIKVAKSRNCADNIDYEVCDITTEIPGGKYDNVILDFGYPLNEYFSIKDLHKIYRDINTRMTDDGIFTGYTILSNVELNKSSDYFKNAMECIELMRSYFNRVEVRITEYADRKNVYFSCESQKWLDDEK